MHFQNVGAADCNALGAKLRVRRDLQAAEQLKRANHSANEGFFPA